MGSLPSWGHYFRKCIAFTACWSNLVVVILEEKENRFVNQNRDHVGGIEELVQILDTK